MKKLIFSIVIALVCAISFSSCESYSRELKSLSSDMTGGLNRKLVLMDYTGDTIKTWEGKFDIQEQSGDNRVFFDLNGKRVWIQGGITVSEEY